MRMIPKNPLTISVIGIAVALALDCTQPCPTTCIEQYCKECARCEQIVRAEPLRESVREQDGGDGRKEQGADQRRETGNHEEPYERNPEATPEPRPEPPPEERYPNTTTHFYWKDALIYDAALHPTRPQLLLSYGEPMAELFSLETKKRIRIFGPGLIPTGNLCWSANECPDDAERCYEGACWTESAALGHIDRVRRVKFSESGKYVLTAGEDGAAIVWDLEGSTRTVLGPGRTKVENSKCNIRKPRNETCGKGEMCYEGKCWAADPWNGHFGAVNDIEFDEYRKLAYTAGNDLQIIEWNANTGKISRTFELKHSKRITALLWADLGTIFMLVSVSDDQTIRVWDTNVGRQTCMMAFNKPVETARYAQSAFTQKGGRVYLKDFAGHVEVYDPIKCHRVYGEEFDIADSSSFALAVDAPGKRLVTSTRYGDVLIINPSTQKVVQTLKSGIQYTRPLPTTPGSECDDQRACQKGMECVVGYCTKTDYEIGHAFRIERAVWHPAGTRLVTSDLAGHLFVWPIP